MRYRYFTTAIDFKDKCRIVVVFIKIKNTTLQKTRAYGQIYQLENTDGYKSEDVQEVSAEKTR